MDNVGPQYTERRISASGKIHTAHTMKDFALEYAKRGWYVFPVWGIHQGRCRCQSGSECKSPGKHPMQKSWQKLATTDPDVICQIDWTDKNIGIATGEKSKLFIVDIDTKNDGEVHLKKWEQQNHPLKDDARVVTGSGGYHYYFSYPKDFGKQLRNKAGVLPGVDIRADGGFVVAPPSKHVSGGIYEWEV